MNAANGFTEKHDDLPDRFFTSPGYKNENIDIHPIDREAFLTARSKYYRVRKLDQKGTPDPDAAKKLGLEVF
jgi:aldehyde:ferredoxin oxidoreductase